jgi:peptidoglycan hydrolase-like protein with peptidoglycan-binding domain
MRNAFLAGASAVALMLGGCSMFHSGDQKAQSPASQQTPAYSGSSQAPRQTTSQPQHDATTDQMGSTSSQSMSDHAMAKHAMNADRVRQAQQKLKDDGDYMGQVDGKFGSQTAQALKQFQQKNGLKQTGRLDRNTLDKLRAGTAGSGSSTTPIASPSVGTAVPPAASPNSGTAMPPAKTPNAGTAAPPATTPGGSL